MFQERGKAASVPPYWEEAKAELMKRDRIMNRLIPQFGDLHLVGHVLGNGNHPERDVQCDRWHVQRNAVGQLQRDDDRHAE